MGLDSREKIDLAVAINPLLNTVLAVNSRGVASFPYTASPLSAS